MERFTQNTYVDRLCKVLLICMAAVAWYSFVTTPFTADIKVFFAAADQVQYQPSSGIMAVFEAWELKGIGNRLLMYGIYLVADAVVGAFYMGAPSYSRYFFNLPMQRFKVGDTWVCQQEQYALLMQYTGKYIVYSDWFGIEKYPQLQQKLETEYERIDGKDLLLYTPSWDVFSLTDVQAIKPGAYILIRK